MSALGHKPTSQNAPPTPTIGLGRHVAGKARPQQISDKTLEIWGLFDEWPRNATHKAY
jgi:hypothetical protein